MLSIEAMFQKVDAESQRATDLEPFNVVAIAPENVSIPRMNIELTFLCA